MRSDAGKGRISKYDRARLYFAHIIESDGRKNRDHYNFAYNQRAESPLFQVAEIYAVAAGEAAAAIDEIMNPEIKTFHTSLMAQPFILVRDWENDKSFKL